MVTLHLIGSKGLGGAENWFFRFTCALDKVYGERGLRVVRGIRKGSELTSVDPEGISTHELPFYTVWDPFSRWSISKLIDEVSPDIVQTYMGRATRLTHIQKNRGCVHIARLGGYYKLHSYVHAHAWIGNTKGVCDYLIREGFPPDRVFHISNFVEMPERILPQDIERVKKELSLKDENFIILSIGRMVPVKGHKYLLQAMHYLKEQNLSFLPILVMVGDGPLKKDLMKLARELHIENLVRWAGWRRDINTFYALGDLVVFPSLSQETLGNVILEAWSHKRPVICTKFPGALEITTHGEDVIQVPCEDSLQLARAMALLIKDESLRLSLGEKGYNKVFSLFDKKRILEQYFSLYSYLLKT